ncbi:nicotinate phosphoribosyltransferase [Marasmius crinis-equi]|uniref:Nicotinate phosphoribosyltransferase n=1 Tax=Marasmius crinis-equi TaxID=585013 RepID=A0ABR3F078_9AGAR
MSKLAVPPSILDTDLYKLTMQQAVLQHFPSCQVSYRFTNRDRPHVVFSRACYESFASSVSKFNTLSLIPAERTWLSKACPFFNPQYLDFLENYRFKPDQVDIKFIPTQGDESDPQSQKGHIEITVTGPWVETILWETPLMACLSESYFAVDDVDWNYDGQEELAYEKGKTLLEAGCALSEFGTRRRRSYKNQDIVMKGLVKASQEIHGPGVLVGTSNTHLAHLHNIRPVGTIAHEWFMGLGALKGYENVHDLALDLWEQVYYPKSLLLALTDTFSSEAFYQSFVKSHERARRWDGLRQDSGDPFVYAERAREVYQTLGIDHTQKLVIYSDGLNVDKAVKLKKLTDEIGFKSSFGIGTFLTNDFKKASDGKEKSKPLNIVIKLASADGNPCVKISDEISKNTGDQATAEHIKKVFGLPSSA